MTRCHKCGEQATHRFIMYYSGAILLPLTSILCAVCFDERMVEVFK